MKRETPKTGAPEGLLEPGERVVLSSSAHWAAWFGGVLRGLGLLGVGVPAFRCRGGGCCALLRSRGRGSRQDLDGTHHPQVRFHVLDGSGRRRSLSLGWR